VRHLRIIQVILVLATILSALFVVSSLIRLNEPQPVEIVGTVVPPVPDLDVVDIQKGRALYDQYCAECHGANIEGADDWKQPLADGSFPAPPHDDSGHTWHHPDFLLVDLIESGGGLYDGAMPAFKDVLTKTEIEYIITFFKSEWGQEALEYQWWLSNTYPTPNPEGE
jgi:mono/diheme cytochrome c family protein